MSIPFSSEDLTAQWNLVQTHEIWGPDFTVLLQMLAADADFVVDQAEAAAVSAAAAALSAAAAVASAGSVNMPTLLGKGGMFLRAKPAEDGMEWVSVADSLLADTGNAANTFALSPSPAKAAYSTDDTFYFRARTGDSSRVGQVNAARVGATTSSSAVVNLSAGTTTGLAVGMSIAGTGIQAGSTIASIQSLTQFTMNQNSASAQSGITYTFTKIVTCTITSGYNFQVTSGNTSNLMPGMQVSGSGIPGGTYITSVTDSTHFVASAACTNASGISTTAIIPVVELILTTGTTSGITAGMLLEGSMCPLDTTVASIVDGTHILLSRVPTTASAQTVTVNSGKCMAGGCIVNINSLGNKAIKLPDGSDPGSSQIRAGGLYLLKFDGTNMQLLNASPLKSLSQPRIYNAAGTYTFQQGVDCPSSVLSVYVEVTGSGGGGGSGANGYWSGAGGGGGGKSYGWVALTAGQSVTVTIGAAGIGGVGGNSSGTGGNTCSFGSLASATGGNGGGYGQSGVQGSGGSGGAGTGPITASGSSGVSSPSNPGAGGSGGNAGGTTTTGAIGANSAGAAGGAYGGGGAGGGSNGATYNGGNGAVGAVLVSW